ncbi:NHL repeat-containing protein [Lysobacter dokdonensis DS-58]|uniref:NHL repeat-containing protein n=1 Tax=Lysobacter dokdonensis DS-58 TaxID=1300345 RepID=A0A0A2WM58_9GAMM|nr:hypothetical protein [Lysobacter dokdonensis]KGQ19370.1 NHL repeat-containing protein [Lysobacter dokdonensis DS-58]
MNCDKDTGTGACEPLALERIRYFTGRHMTSRDFTDADAYHRTMRHLHNRVLHGVGVGCGLEVRLHPRPECGVIVHCGLAIDCCGREIVLRKAVSVRIDWEAWPKNADGKPEDDYVLVLCLEYCELHTEKVPVLYSADACAGHTYEEGRIRESHALRWRAVRVADLGKYGWRSSKGCPPGEGDDDCKPCHDDATARCCIDPACPPCHCVPIAIVRGDEDAPVLVTRGRPRLPQSQEQLTHICWISWPHGGAIPLSAFDKLQVRFDRPITDPASPVEPGPRGINERTFVVQYGQQREDLDFVMFRDKGPFLLPDKRTAQFDVLRPDEYLGDTIHVTLRCDFIVDCDDNPVDGDHLRGRLPTGNGLAGGTFESWFKVMRDDDYEQMMKAAGPGETS